MNEAAFRDVEKSSGGRSEASSERDFELGLGQNQWRDKIEVRLDNRQVFFLFFGSALCACMLFVLGVIVGKRLESRGRAAIPEVQDPLAVLDRMSGGAAPGGASASAKAEASLTFPKALISPSARPHGAAVTASRAAAAAPAPALPAAAVRVPVAPKVVPPVAPRPAPAPAKVTAIANGKLAATVAAKPALPSAATVAVAPPAAPAAVTPPPSARGKYSLVLSSFPERAEAEALAKRFAAQGAYVAIAESPGKANVYRVRVGNYASTQEAATAKTAFERETKTIAYVAGR